MYWSLSLLLWMLWFWLWKEQILHFPLPSIFRLLHCWIWLCWHLSPQLLTDKNHGQALSPLNTCRSYLASFLQETIALWFFGDSFFLSLLQITGAKAGHSFSAEHKGNCIYYFFFKKPLWFIVIFQSTKHRKASKLIGIVAYTLCQLLQTSLWGLFDIECWISFANKKDGQGIYNWNNFFLQFMYTLSHFYFYFFIFECFVSITWTDSIMFYT